MTYHLFPLKPYCLRLRVARLRQILPAAHATVGAPVEGEQKHFAVLHLHHPSQGLLQYNFRTHRSPREKPLCREVNLKEQQ